MSINLIILISNASQSCAHIAGREQVFRGCRSYVCTRLCRSPRVTHKRTHARMHLTVHVHITRVSIHAGRFANYRHPWNYRHRRNAQPTGGIVYALTTFLSRAPRTLLFLHPFHLTHTYVQSAVYARGARLFLYSFDLGTAFSFSFFFCFFLLHGQRRVYELFFAAPRWI